MGQPGADGRRELPGGAAVGDHSAEVRKADHAVGVDPVLAAHLPLRAGEIGRPVHQMPVEVVMNLEGFRVERMDAQDVVDGRSGRRHAGIHLPQILRGILVIQYGNVRHAPPGTAASRFF